MFKPKDPSGIKLRAQRKYVIVVDKSDGTFTVLKAHKARKT